MSTVLYVLGWTGFAVVIVWFIGQALNDMSGEP